MRLRHQGHAGNAGWRLWRAGAGIAFGLVLVVGGGCMRSPVEEGDALEAFTGHLDERLPGLMESYDVPGATVALVRGGELVWSGAYGHTDRERTRKMAVDAVFRAESISKSVTAWGVMRLVEQGRIDLDAPVERYLGGFELPASAYGEHAVTVRRLLSHSAGMPLGPIGAAAEYAPQREVPPLRDYLRREAHLVHEPGAGFVYSNVGFNLLELLVEAVTDRDFAAYMADEVLRPLGMRRSRFAWADTLYAAMPVGHDLQGAPVPPYVYAAQASGGLLAPVADIARFVGAGMTGARAATRADSTRRPGVLDRASLRALYAPQVPIPGLFGLVADAYGFGHFIETLPDGRRAVWHGGQGHGWMTHFHAVPASGDGIVILTNSQRSWPLMAEVLQDWARWSGAGAVKMGRITYAVMALRALIGVIVLVTLGQVYRLARGLRRGSRRWAPLAHTDRGVRLLQAALGTGGIVALAWSAAQPYLFVSSIFPGLAGWAGRALLVLSVALILLALLPRVGRRGQAPIVGNNTGR